MRLPLRTLTVAGFTSLGMLVGVWSNAGKTSPMASLAATTAEVKINEVASQPVDWIELVNAGATLADISGWSVRDSDDRHVYTFPPGTMLASGGYLVVEGVTLDFGLGGQDSARLFSPAGALLDSHVWTAHAPTTYGRCPNGTGAFVTTNSLTKGAVNACPSESLAWPGSPDVTTVDGFNVLGRNTSGLAYESSAGPNRRTVLWAVKNNPGTLFRLVSDGAGSWTPDSANNWRSGKALRYPGEKGNPDAEGLTFAATGSSSGIYVATERNNDANRVSRNSVLRFDPGAAGVTLTATHEWNVTALLPAVGPNLGIEAITWIPDTYLQAHGFTDDAAGGTYNPASYPNHGDGLFFVGVEGTGAIYAFALNHATNAATRISTISSAMPGVMDAIFDRDLGQLWVVCDDSCQGRSTVLTLRAGRFTLLRSFARPSNKPNLNSEGFTVTPLAECVAGRRPAFWADDAATAGHVIRAGTVTCSPF